VTDPPLSTMASPMAANPTRDNHIASNASHNPPATSVTKNFVTRDFDLVFHAFFPVPTAPTKFNPIVAMKQLF